MREFGLVLRKLRKSRGLNQEELAQALGVRKSTISNYETSYSTPTSAMLRLIADFFSVNVSELLGETVSVKEESIASTYGKKIPIYSSITVDEDSPILYHLEMPTSFIGEGTFFGFEVTNERMNDAGITPGSVVIVRKQTFVDDGEIVLVSVGEEPPFICRYYRVGEFANLVSESTLPIYRPLVVNVFEQPVKVLGKIVKIIQTLF